MPRLTLFFALLSFSIPEGCSSDPPTAAQDAGPPSVCPTGFLGDPQKDPVIEVHAIRADGTDVVLNEGDDLALLLPPQGGRVSFVGVRATNLDGCGVQVTGALRDPLTNQIRVDGRTVNLNREADGWGTTGSGANLEDPGGVPNYSNIPLCGNDWADQDVYDKPFALEVLVEDRRKKSVSVKMTVTPRCSEVGDKRSACLCLCKKGYVLGDLCNEDAGVTDGGDQ